ncbi:hypothetical protein BDR03DRAFT_946434 [Suillus americanus]|nr:hypothetical protein BDR03DRAFT_946434 [Suillus americanus]
MQSVNGSVLEPPLEDAFGNSPGENGLWQRGGEYKIVTSDHNIMARANDTASVHDMMDIRTL